jgi:hypothetical protein
MRPTRSRWRQAGRSLSGLRRLAPPEQDGDDYQQETLRNDRYRRRHARPGLKSLCARCKRAERQRRRQNAKRPESPEHRDQNAGEAQPTSYTWVERSGQARDLQPADEAGGGACREHCCHDRARFAQAKAGGQRAMRGEDLEDEPSRTA